MALAFSAEKILGWRSQYEALRRWHRRCESFHDDLAYYNTSLADGVDFVLAFFVVCYHMRDYAIQTGKISRSEMDSLIRKNRYMRICRDVCNRSKHHTLNQPSIDRDWSILGENMTRGGKEGKNCF